MLQVDDMDRATALTRAFATEVAIIQRHADEAVEAREKQQALLVEVEAARLVFFDEVINRVEMGFWNIAGLLSIPHISNLVETLSKVDQELCLWSLCDDRWGMSVDLSPARIGVSVGFVTSSEEDGTFTRWYRPDRKSFPPGFAALLNQEFSFYWYDMGSQFDVKDAQFARGKLGLKEFASLDLKKLKKSTPGWINEVKAMQTEMTGVSSAWQENGISPGQVLVKFIYDCADPKVLQQHLSDALKHLEI
jgi:hypothetical protein